jgi:transposase
VLTGSKSFVGIMVTHLKPLTGRKFTTSRTHFYHTRLFAGQQIQDLGHKMIVANVRELRAISHSDRKSDKVDAEKLARYARLVPEILRPIAHWTVVQQETLTLIRARDVLMRLRIGSVNSVRGLAKPCGYRLQASSTLTCLWNAGPSLDQPRQGELRITLQKLPR